MERGIWTRILKGVLVDEGRRGEGSNKETHTEGVDGNEGGVNGRRKEE